MSEKDKIVDVKAKEVNETEETKEKTKGGFLEGFKMKLRMVDWKKVAKVAGGVAVGAMIAGVSYSLGANSANRDEDEPYGIPDYLDDTDAESNEDNSEEDTEETEE